MYPCDGKDSDFRTPFRDLALIEVMRKCNFTATPDTLMVYGINTNQQFMEDAVVLDDWKKRQYSSNSDATGHLLMLYKKPVESYIIDCWKRHLMELHSNVFNDVLITTKSVAAIINGLSRAEYMSEDNMIAAISSIASAIELDEQSVYNDYETMNKNSVTVRGSKVWNVYNLWFGLNDKYDLVRSDDVNMIRQFKDVLCNHAKVCVYMKDGDTLRTGLRISWDRRLTNIERAKSPSYNKVIRRVAMFKDLSPDAIVAADMRSNMYCRLWSEDSAAIDNTAECRYLLEELKRMEDVRRHKEMLRKQAVCKVADEPVEVSCEG